MSERRDRLSAVARRNLLLRGLIYLGASVALLDAAPARSADPPSSAATPALTKNAVLHSPIGAEMLSALGPLAKRSLAPSTGQLGALVALPLGARASDLGLDAVAPGIGRIRGSAAKIEAFSAAHPDLNVEIAPPLHTLMDKAGQWVLAAKARETRAADGHGVLVGVADTGLDVHHPEMRTGAGKTRVAWMLDLSLPAAGLHPELEERFGIKDDDGKTMGRVLSRDDIDTMLAQDDTSCESGSLDSQCAPFDEIGHGTHVTGIAAGSGANGGKYAGIAPSADVVFVRVSHANSDGVESDDLVRAVEFMFDRADVEKRPMVVNMSLGSDFGPHDGSLLWEQAIASHVGPDHPGHAIVAAAGNSGSIAETPTHQSVHVSSGGRTRVPIHTEGSDAGAVQIWVTLRRGADIKIGLDGPDGEWIAPIESGRQSGKNTSEYQAAVIYGPQFKNSPIPDASHSGVVVWQNKWPAGTYNVTLEGSGMAELYMQGVGEVSLVGSRPAYFVHGVREGTINLPATHPSIIGVGCTVNRPRWESIDGADVIRQIPVLDSEGGLPLSQAITPQTTNALLRPLVDGEVCWFSSAGPTATGVPKPEISAPGGFVVSAMSRTAKPGTWQSMFTSRACPSVKSGKDSSRCLQIDDTHGIAVGTSMSSPIVAGVVALLLQEDPTLTQDKIVALLQAGAHRFRQPASFEDQSGPGEVDALASLDALEQMRHPELHVPALEQSWITLSSDYVSADGSTPLTAIVELRTADGAHRGDFFDAPRLQPVILVDGAEVKPAPQMIRRGPGVWFYVWNPPPGLGGKSASFSATFDGAPIVTPRSVPIATDRWTAAYASDAKGSACAFSPARRFGAFGGATLGLAALAFVRRRKKSSAR